MIEFSQRNGDPFAAFCIGIDLLTGLVEPVHDFRHIGGTFFSNWIPCNPCCAVVRLLQAAHIYHRRIPSSYDGLCPRHIY